MRRSQCDRRLCAAYARCPALSNASFVGFTGTPIERTDANTRAVLVKCILRKYNYPPDKQEKATQTVLEQAEVLSEIWVGA